MVGERQSKGLSMDSKQMMNVRARRAKDIELLVREVAASARRANAALDDALDFVSRSERRIEDMDRRRQATHNRDQGLCRTGRCGGEPIWLVSNGNTRC